MKEIDGNLTSGKDDYHEEVTMPKDKYSGSLRKIPGLKLFEFNTDSMTLSEYEPEIVASINRDSSVGKHEKVKSNPEYLYIQALNYKNAIKKINRILEANMGVKEFFSTKFIKNHGKDDK